MFNPCDLLHLSHCHCCRPLVPLHAHDCSHSHHQRQTFHVVAKRPRSNMKDALDLRYKAFEALPLVYERFSESSSPSVLEIGGPCGVGEICLRRFMLQRMHLSRCCFPPRRIRSRRSVSSTIARCCEAMTA